MVEEAECSKFHGANLEAHLRDFVQALAIGAFLAWFDDISVAFAAGGCASLAFWFGFVAFDPSYCREVSEIQDSITSDPSYSCTSRIRI